MTKIEIEIRECVRPKEFDGCVRLEREIFKLPEVEISPVRHFIITRHAGGFTLGAFAGERLVGFVLSVLAFSGNEKIFYSHMTAIDKDFQNYGIGTRLKWSQRKRALQEGVSYIKWTFQPVQARNAFFNLEKLGASVKEYHPNFYGMDYGAIQTDSKNEGIDSDRLFAEWNLKSERVEKLAAGKKDIRTRDASLKIRIPNDWNGLIVDNPAKAISEQLRVRKEFQSGFSKNLVCRGFERDETNPKFLLYDE
jgi:predicted GNAT superfamily acetyltransferase